jgi:hypothetical protein
VEFDGIQLKEGLKPTLFDTKAVIFARNAIVLSTLRRLRRVTGRRRAACRRPPRRRREKRIFLRDIVLRKTKSCAIGFYSPG